MVRVVIPCEEVRYEPTTDKIMLVDPLPVAAIPPGAAFPVDVEELWVYAQLCEGVGTFRLSIELRQVYDDGTAPRPVCRSEPRHLTFPGANQLNVYESVLKVVGTLRVPWGSQRHTECAYYFQDAFYDVPFRLTDLPFEGPGLYEFRVLADDQELQGQTGVMRVFDPRTTP